MNSSVQVFLYGSLIKAHPAVDMEYPFFSDWKDFR